MILCPLTEAPATGFPESEYRRFALTPQLMLTLDRSETPPALHPYLTGVSELPGRVFVAHVLSRMEKQLAYDLIDRDISYYLPLAQRERYSGRKRYYTEEPIFPQYVFVACAEDSDESQAETMARCMGTRRVCRTIPVKSQSILRNDLVNLAAALEANPRIEQCPFVRGQRVRIVEGPFRNLEGFILEREHSAVLVLRVGDMCASMEIPRVMVEPV